MRFDCFNVCHCSDDDTCKCIEVRRINDANNRRVRAINRYTIVTTSVPPQYISAIHYSVTVSKFFDIVTEPKRQKYLD